MKPDGRMRVACAVCLFLVFPILAWTQSDPVMPEKESSAAVSEADRLTRREEEIKQQLKQLAGEMQEVQQQVLEIYRAQQDLQQGIDEKDEEVAELRRRIAEAEKEVQELREQITQALVARPEYVEIKTRRDAAFVRRSEITRQENALSEELVRVQIRLREIQSGPPSEAGPEAP